MDTRMRRLKEAVLSWKQRGGQWGGEDVVIQTLMDEAMDGLLAVLTKAKQVALGPQRKDCQHRGRLKHPLSREQKRASVRIGLLGEMQRCWWRPYMDEHRLELEQLRTVKLRKKEVRVRCIISANEVP